MKIPKSDCPPNFFIRPQDFENQIFLAKIDQWRYPKFAMGKYHHLHLKLLKLTRLEMSSLYNVLLDHAGFVRIVQNLIVDLA